jgi:multicomponent Na+:H+ antiporter subunit D
MSTPDGYLLVLVLTVPVVALLLAFVLGGRNAERVTLLAAAVGLVIAGLLAVALWRSDQVLIYILGGWAPPLGIALRADGLSATMLVTVAVVVCATALFARAEFRTPEGEAEARGPFSFWTLLLAVWAGMNLVFLGGDLFNLYVALELLTFAAVPLVALDGRAETFQAALRYLAFALPGSLLYLLGVALFYGAYGTLDIALLSALVRPEPVTWAAGALMTVGLLAKTALFPLHLWLPPAHAGAPAPASAVLSALVVKGSFFIVIRLWFDVMPAVPGEAAAQLLAVLGAAAILVSSVVALRQARLKLLIAYSTLAQIGYLFLMFPLAYDPGSGQLVSGAALTGGMMQTVSHAIAKAAMFMTAGLLYGALGHDRIAELGGAARALPVTVFAFGLAGVSLIGLPPSGGFLAKWLLLSTAVATGNWWLVVVILIGGLLSAGYVFMVVTKAMGSPSAPLQLRAAVPRHRELVALGLALLSVLLGLVALGPIDLILAGRPDLVLVPAQ